MASSSAKAQEVGTMSYDELGAELRQMEVELARRPSSRSERKARKALQRRHVAVWNEFNARTRERTADWRAEHPGWWRLSPEGVRWAENERKQEVERQRRADLTPLQREQEDRIREREREWAVEERSRRERPYVDPLERRTAAWEAWGRGPNGNPNGI